VKQGLVKEGVFGVQVGASAEDIRLTGEFTAL